MIISPYRTQLTRMIQNREPNPSRSDLNRKAIEQPSRKALWLLKKEAKK